MRKNLTIIISILLTFALAQCSGSFFDEYEKGRYVEENPPAPDNTPPELVKAVAVDAETIELEFSEELSAESVQNIENYYIQGLNRLEIIDSTLKDDRKTASLTLAVQPRERRMKNGMEYTALVQNVADVMGNAISFRTAAFTGMGWVIAELTGTPPAITNSTGIDISITGSDIVAYQYMIDDGAWTAEIPAAIPISLTGLSEGYHTLKVVGKKSDGEWQEINYATVFGWEIDITPPTAGIFNAPENMTNQTYVNIMVTAPDIVSYRYKIDSSNDPVPGEYSDVIPISAIIALSGLEAGEYTLSVVGIDAAGNEQEIPTIFTWTIVESTGIVAALSNVPAKTTKSTITDITVGGQRVMYYKYSIDGSDWNEFRGINNTIYLDNLSESTHNLQVIGADEAGIEQIEPTEYSWTVDNSAPIASISNVPASPTSSQMIHVIVSGDQVVSYRYKIDTGLWSGLINSQLAIDISGLTEGQHTLYVSGVDSVGNEQKDDYTLLPQDRATTHTWTIDITPPTAVLSGTPAALNSLTALDVTVSGTGVIAYKYKLDSASWSGEINYTIKITGLITEGSHQLSVLGRDNAGNWQSIYSPTTCSWVTDNTPPTAIFVNTPNDPTPFDSIEIYVTGATAIGYKYRIDGETWLPNANMDTAPTSYYLMTDPIERSGLPDDVHTLEVIARDTIGNWQVTPTLCTWEIDENTPVITISGVPSSLTKEKTATITVELFTGIVEFESYRYSVDYGAWSGEIIRTVDNTIDLDFAAEPDKQHVLQVIGKTTGDEWQTLANVTKASWRVDTAAPKAILSYLPNNPTSNITTYNETTGGIVVQGIEATGYKYRIDGDPWVPNATFDTNPANCIALTTPINETVTVDPHIIEVVVRDEAGNWQSIDAPLDAPTSYSWTVNASIVIAELSNIPGVNNGYYTTSTGADIIVSPSNYEGYIFRYSTDGEVVDGLMLDHLTPDPSENWYAIRPMSEHIVLSSLPDGKIYLEVKAKDVLGNWQTAATEADWTIDTKRPVAGLFNTPSNPSGVGTTEITVGTSNGPLPDIPISPTPVWAYKYRVDLGEWQYGTDPVGGISISEEIALTLGNGYHRLDVIGRSQAGMWQLASAPTTYTWIIDTTDPALNVVGLPPATPATTLNKDINIAVGGTGVTHYKYIITTPPAVPDTDWYDGIPDPGTPVSTLIQQTGLSVEKHHIYIVGYSLAGRRSEVLDREWEIVNLTAPTPTSPTNPDYDVLLQFTWDNPDGVNKVYIQISTANGADFESHIVLPETEVTTPTKEYYNYTINTANGPRYYARLKVEDTEGNPSNWGAISDAVYVVGSISGQVLDQDGNAVVGASITLQYMPNTNVPGFPTGSTVAGGNFILQDVPFGDNYKIVASNGTSYAAKNNITVPPGENTDIGILYLVISGLDGAITGTIWDANTALAVNDTYIEIIDYKNDPIYTNTLTGTNSIDTSTPLLPAGTYTLVVAKSGYYDLYVDNIVNDGGKDIGRQAVCEILAEPQVRVILMWGITPTDLDLHLVGPTDKTDTTVTPYNNRFHAQWRNDYKSWDEATATYIAGTWNATLDRWCGDIEGTHSTASLVQDNTDNYGPESQNLFRYGGVQYARGIFTYTVYNWSGGTWVPDGYSITMRVYDSLGMVRELNFPSSGPDTWSGEDPRYWKALKINIQGIGRANRTIHIINKFDGTLDESSKSSMDW